MKSTDAMFSPAPAGGAQCYVIAEAGVNHNGDPALAHRLVDLAADAGADAVKFQVFIPGLLVADGTPRAAYQAANDPTPENQLEMLERLTLPRAVFEELAAHAAERDITFLATAFDEESADVVESLGVPVFKIPSGEITNHALIAHVARKHRPMLISTGMATVDEIADALAVLHAAGDVPLALLHCVSSYPAEPADCNLRAIGTLAEQFGLPVGWSDHTEGIDITIAAVALGASIVEKHFTSDRALPGPDHRASLEPAALAAMIRGIRRVTTALGDGAKRPMPGELAVRELVRRSLFLRVARDAGHRLEAADLIALRPATGLSPAELNSIVGRRLRQALPAGVQLGPGHLE